MKNTPKSCPIKNKKIFLIVSISVAILLVVIDLILFSTSLKQTGVGCGFSRFWKDKDSNLINDDNKMDNTPIIQEDGFSLESRYIGDNIWEYTVTGQLPNPCYLAKVDVMVAESYPEQVTVNVNITEPKPDIMCAQVIQDFEYSNTFTASEKAVISLTVSRVTP